MTYWPIPNTIGIGQYERKNNMKLKIEKNIDVPVYGQIVNYVIKQIKKREYLSGHKLPPERDLAEELAVARGTVKKAYEELEKKGLVHIVRGSGHFVSGASETSVLNRKEKAVNLISRMLSKLERMNFSYKEIKNFFHLIIMEREQRLGNFHIAIIDCNPEALSIFEKQLMLLSNVNVYKFLLEDLFTIENPGECFKQYDLILTTTTHYNDIVKLLQDIKKRIVKAAVSPSQQTIVEIAGIKKNAKVGIVCRSNVFCTIVKERLADFQIGIKKLDAVIGWEIKEIEEFLLKKDIIIVPPDIIFSNNKELKPFLNLFTERGGRFIKFDYQMERGSLIHIDEQISSLLNMQENI